MIKIVRNYLEGHYAVPVSHPVTCMNAAPWQITELELDSAPDNGCKVWIRGPGAMWFRADQCFVGSKTECENYLHQQTQRDTLELLTDDDQPGGKEG